jgi:HK97 family phage portal protein
MSYLTQLFDRRNVEDPKMALTSKSLVEILSGPPSVTGKAVSPSTALQLTAVYACISLISETFGSLPAILYRRSGKGRERAVDHTLYPVLHDFPNPELTSIEFRSNLMAHVLLWGHGYAEIVRNGAGYIKQLWPLPPNRVTAGRNSRNELIYTVQLPDNTSKNLRADRILHISAPLGLSPISQARESLGITMAAEEYAGRFYSNDSSPGGVLEHPGSLSKEAAARLRDNFEIYHGGLENRHRIAVLEEGMKWQSIGLPPEDSQFLETRKFQIAEIARLYRVPPFMIGDVERSTSWGTGIEQQNIGFVTYSLRSWLVRWEQEIKKTLLTETERAQYFVEFLVDGLLRGDYKTRQEGLAIQRQNGVINADEWRELENMNEIPGGKGKIYLANSAMTPVGQTVQASAPAPAAEVPAEDQDQGPDQEDKNA